jgi:hypothetical protein
MLTATRNPWVRTPFKKERSKERKRKKKKKRKKERLLSHCKCVAKQAKPY